MVEPLLSLYSDEIDEEYLKQLLEGVFLTRAANGSYCLAQSRHMSSNVATSFLELYLKSHMELKQQHTAAKSVANSTELKELKETLKKSEDLILNFLDIADLSPTDI